MPAQNVVRKLDPRGGNVIRIHMISRLLLGCEEGYMLNGKLVDKQLNNGSRIGNRPKMRIRACSKAKEESAEQSKFDG